MSLTACLRSGAVHLIVFAAAALGSDPAAAARASLLVDMDSGAVLHADGALRPARPASLTKLMTLYVAFAAVSAGQLAGDDALTISPAAAAAAPVRLGLKAGATLTLDAALTGLIVTSGNDVAVAIAETVAGTEPAFVARMNAVAGKLGLTATRYTNASGLPDPGQVTSARDLALLTRALHADFPREYARFAATAFTHAGRRIETHNNFVRAYAGASGVKTGFTCRAGFNLVATAARNGRHLLGVVLGEAGAAARDARMVRLMNAGFAGRYTPAYTLDAFPDPLAQGRDEALNAQMIATECINPEPGREYFRVRRWSILLGGVDMTRRAALARARQFMREHRGLLRGGRPMLVPRWARDVIWQIGITDLSQRDATNTCLGIRGQSTYCVVRSPAAAQFAMRRALRVMDAVSQPDSSVDGAR